MTNYMMKDEYLSETSVVDNSKRLDNYQLRSILIKTFALLGF